MKLLLKMMSILVVWGLVGYIVVYVDPETIRDLGVVGLYLPFVVVVVFATWYTTMMIYRSLLLSIVIAILIAVGLTLSIVQLMNIFTGIAIILLMAFSLYLFKSRDSLMKSEKTKE